MTISNITLVDNFIKGKESGKAANMFIKGNVLYDYGYHFPMLVKTKLGMLMNADKYSSTTSHHQSLCMGYATLQVPFSVLLAAKIITGSGRYLTESELDKIELIQKAPERWDWTGKWTSRTYNEIKISDYRTRTITKTKTISDKEYQSLTADEKKRYTKQEERRPESALLRVGDKYYLSSMDGWNYFMCLLPEPVNTVDEAFEALIPTEVKDKKYVRQGEWFFVEAWELTSLVKALSVSGIKHLYQKMAPKLVLPKKNPNSNSHIATRGWHCKDDKLIFVTGQIRHQTRWGGRGEHAMLRLSTSDNPKIFLAYENRAVESYSASGRVD